MSHVLCAQCGVVAAVRDGLCGTHLPTLEKAEDEWATTNRIMCDFFHRQKLPPRIDSEHRKSFWPDDDNPDDTILVVSGIVFRGGEAYLKKPRRNIFRTLRRAVGGS